MGRGEILNMKIVYALAKNLGFMIHLNAKA